MPRTTKGRLYTRGKRGYYYLQYYINGQQIRVALKDDSGNNITTEKKAKEAASKILLPLTARNEADRFRLVANELKTAEEKAETAERGLKNAAATIDNGWKLFMSCQSRPPSCKRYPVDEIPRHSTPGNYAGYYRQFSEWIKNHHSEILFLSHITPEIAGDYISYLDSLKISSGTFNKIIQFFKMFYCVLLDDEKIICKNPFEKIKRKEQISNSREPLSMEQIAGLIKNADGELKLLFTLGYFTGLRFGDCCTLLWREIDLLRGVIERIPRKIKHTRKDKASAVVKIGIPAFLHQMLAEIPEAHRNGYVLPQYGESYSGGMEALLSRRVLNHFHKCGIQTIRPGTGIPEQKDEHGKVIQKKVRAVVEVGFHSLRYSYISHNAERGTPQAIIQKNAGHANPAMTEHYTRISDSAAVKYASVLALPQLTEGETIDVTPEPEREELKDLIPRLKIETIKRMLEIAKSE